MSKETGVITRVNYEVTGQNIELTLMDVKNYLVSGNANKVTNQEVGMFLKLCEGQKLNPFLREAYLVKYGDQAAQMVVGKDAFTKRAEMNENYKGAEAGIIVVNLKGDLEERKGTFYIKSKNREELVGGWAKVHFKDGKEEVYHTVSIDEYNTNKSLWASKPATMIRKVALVQALREAFPNALSQMYTAEEVGVDEELPIEPISKQEEWNNQHIEERPKMASKTLKNQVMQLAKEKELMIGKGKDANIEALEELANNNGMSLRALTEDQANNLIKILMEYQIVKDVLEENIQPVEDETQIIDADVVEEDKNDVIDEDNPF
ncbi:phage recombination protein Bet [Clostridium botulinum]|nr:phage recombination protein Bet [Clostridium botulinum]